MIWRSMPLYLAASSWDDTVWTDALLVRMVSCTLWRRLTTITTMIIYRQIVDGCTGAVSWWFLIIAFDDHLYLDLKLDESLWVSRIRCLFSSDPASTTITHSHARDDIRLVWDPTIFKKQQDEEGSSCNGTSSDLHPMFSEISRRETESLWVVSEQVKSSIANFWTSLPLQTVSNIVDKKDQIRDPIYTPTIDYTALPTSLLVDTSALPSYFAFSTSTSSSFALYTSLPMIAIIGPPVAMLLPQLNWRERILGMVKRGLAWLECKWCLVED